MWRPLFAALALLATVLDAQDRPRTPQHPPRTDAHDGPSAKAEGQMLFGIIFALLICCCCCCYIASCVAICIPLCRKKKEIKEEEAAEEKSRMSSAPMNFDGPCPY
ncbi:unnamed protein product, partial [Mesorhabditis spiculigera]